MSERIRRWASWALVAVIAATVSYFLGQWQFSRYEAKALNNDRVQTNYSITPRSLDEVLVGGLLDPDADWSPISLTGEFVGAPIILPQRGIPGFAGDHVLTLFVTDDGRTVVVDRGWYPVSHPPESLDAPAGSISLVARVRPAESPSPRGVREHQVFTINPLQVIEAQEAPSTPNVVASLYLLAEEGAPGQGELGFFPKPAENLGNHLSYAFQWWIFAIGAFVGLGVVLYRDITSDSPRPPRKKRVSADIAEEDALIDAQLGEIDEL